jgi:two-component system sensor histidine kinase KdpD
VPREDQDPRPDPLDLLAQANREEERSRRGRLHVFLGAAPGVGKTWAMLSAAQRLAREGKDVVVGVAETHGRAETALKLEGLEVLPRRSVDYRGTTLAEFDLDAALARKPEILVLDELAHTNAPGSRFPKRWEDARAVLEAGISVMTTMNVQHVESLNDVVAQITGVTVRETVPDAVIDEADDVELVDLPPDALLARLQQGKVYVPDAIRPALESFFRKGNLTALRELALRRTAEWVDGQLREYRRDQRIRSVWPAAERILVAVGPSPLSRTLVRAARRMAAGLRAHLIAAYVEPGGQRLAPAASERVMQTLRLAESLGAETALLAGDDPAAELVAFARARDVTRIVVGKTGRSRFAERVWGSFVGDVIRQSGEIDVYAIRREAEADAEPATAAALPREGTLPGPGVLLPYLGAVAVVAVCTAVAWLAFRPPDLSEEVMVLVAGVVVVALRFGRWPAALAAVLSVMACNYFFTEPRFTLRVDDSGYVVSLLVMLVVALIVGTLTARTRERAESARERERMTAALYSMARELTAARDQEEVASVAARHVRDTLDGDAIVLVADAAHSRLRRLATAGSPDWLDEHERSVARWCFDHGKPAGAGTTVLPASAGHYVPLSGAQGRVGVLALRFASDGALDPRQRLLIDTFASQLALALDRVVLIEREQTARVDAEAERLRSSLLSAVSHDLRTPLASIAGSASALLDRQAPADETTRRELLGGIYDEARRLGELVSSIVFATRLGTSAVRLRREWTTVEEIVGAGLAGVRERLGGRRLHTAIPSDLPLVRADVATLAQVVHNLVDNATRHTPSESTIEVSAAVEDGRLVLRVADDGPGLPEAVLGHVFERPLEAGAGGGTGLGLWICSGIVRAHGGRIAAENRTPHGVRFTIALPIERRQPAPPPREPEES